MNYDYDDVDNDDYHDHDHDDDDNNNNNNIPLDLKGCETWSLILREKRRLRVLENRVQRCRRRHLGLRDRGNRGLDETA
jgi:hypothetical protein